MLILKESHQSHFVIYPTHNYARLHGFVKGEVRGHYLTIKLCIHKENVRVSISSLHFVPFISVSSSLSLPIM